MSVRDRSAESILDDIKKMVPGSALEPIAMRVERLAAEHGEVKRILGEMKRIAGAFGQDLPPVMHELMRATGIEKRGDDRAKEGAS